MNSSVSYAPLAEELKGSGLQLIAPDMPGWGGKTDANGDDVDIDSYIHLIAGLINEIRPKKYSIIGYSFGGVIAQGVITVENAEPEHLILVSSLNGGFDIFGVLFVNIKCRNKHRRNYRAINKTKKSKNSYSSKYTHED